MKALLDTHTFLWWNLDSPQLSVEARQFIGNGRNQIYLSAASAWEIAIKFAKGRLTLPEPPETYVATRLQRHNFLVLPIQVSHALAVAHLPDIHQDPFDRLLIAQSQIEKLPLLTADSFMHQYPIETIW